MLYVGEVFGGTTNGENAFWFDSRQPSSESRDSDIQQQNTQSLYWIEISGVVKHLHQKWPLGSIESR